MIYLIFKFKRRAFIVLNIIWEHYLVKIENLKKVIIIIISLRGKIRLALVERMPMTVQASLTVMERVERE